MKAFDTIRLIAAACEAALRVDPSKSPDLAASQVKISSVRDALQTHREEDADPTSVLVLGHPLDKAESAHIEKLLDALTKQPPSAIIRVPEQPQHPANLAMPATGASAGLLTQPIAPGVIVEPHMLSPIEVSGATQEWVSREALEKYLDGLIITEDNLDQIVDSLQLPFECPFNELVSDEVNSRIVAKSFLEKEPNRWYGKGVFTPASPPQSATEAAGGEAMTLSELHSEIDSWLKMGGHNDVPTFVRIDGKDEKIHSLIIWNPPSGMRAVFSSKQFKDPISLSAEVPSPTQPPEGTQLNVGDATKPAQPSAPEAESPGTVANDVPAGITAEHPSSSSSSHGSDESVS